MDATQHRAKVKWLALSVGLTLGVLFIFSDFVFLPDPFRSCSRQKEEELTTFAPSAATTAAAASPSGQRRVVHASPAYPIDQARTSSCQLDAALRQVLVIRTCGPLTPGLRASYAKYASELSASPHYDLWLLYDVGTEARPAPADDEVLAEYYELQREYPGLGLFLYNASDVKALLPTAAYIQKDKAPNFWFHDSSLFLWSMACRPDLWRTPPLQPSRESELYIWTVEHDAIYFGDVSVFLDEHTTNTADFIADYHPLWPNWYHWNESTWRPPYDRAVFNKQHVQRHSMALLRYMYSVALLDVVAFGEIFVSTVCALQPHWCVMAPLERRFIGPAYDWNAFLTDDQVAAMWVDPTQQGKWNHAVLSRKGRKCKSSLGALKNAPSSSPQPKSIKH